MPTLLAGKRGITFMPFSEGPRNCVGQSLAKMEVMTLLAKLLANFRIELAPEMGGRPGVISRESTHLTLQTAGTKGIRCHLHPRSKA
jgi:cytochrome P450